MTPQVTINRLPDKLACQMQDTGMWKDACPVPLDRLVLLTLPYIDFASCEHADGELVCLDVAAEHVAALFSELFDRRFPIDKIQSVHRYGGDDELSMSDNNTSCFNFRAIEGTALESIHSYGLAIDINPKQNPYLIIDQDAGSASIHPKEGWEFLNRNNWKEGMVEELVPVFAKHGFFIWGGNWTTPVDYHHFQPPRGVAELLVAMDPQDAKDFWRVCIDNAEKLKTIPSGQELKPYLELYNDDRADFADQLLQRLSGGLV